MPGHLERLGETLANFEFHQAGWYPYNHLVDVSKIDMVLRKDLGGGRICFRDVQVKYGRLYDCTKQWELRLFDVTSWRFFKINEFTTTSNLFLAYVLAHPVGYDGDIFIFPIADFHWLVSRSIVNQKGQAKVYISRALNSDGGQTRWYLRRSSTFRDITEDTCVEVTSYRRAFRLLD